MEENEFPVVYKLIEQTCTLKDIKDSLLDVSIYYSYDVL